MVIVYSPTELTCFWKTEKVPREGYFRCNCFVKGGMWTSCDIQWKHRPEFCMSIYSPSKKTRKNLVRNSLIRSHTRRTQLHLFSPAQCRDVNKHLKSCKSNLPLTKHFLVDLTVKGNFANWDTSTASGKSSDTSTAFFTRNHVVEEPWLSQSSILYHHVEDSDAYSVIPNDSEIVKSVNDYIENSRFSNPSTLEENSCCQSEDKVAAEDQKCDFSRTLFDEYYPVEEPWLFQPSILSPTSNAKMLTDVSKDEVSVKEEETEPAPCDQHQPIPENLLPDNGNNLISQEDSVATVILINSSICTMQRISVLENEKLVELLLEPVKNNVLCDSVYLGVVTKLVPHMGGAFVNIGCPRPSFMDIKPNREPFIFPPFHRQAEEGGINGSPLSKLGVHPGVPEDKTFSNGFDETDDIEDDEVEDDDIEDNSVEYIDDDFVEHICLDDCDVSDVLENSNGSVTMNGVKTGSKRLEKLSEDGLQPESYIVDYDTNSKKVTGANGSKWAPVRKGTKIIVQVVKEGLGTKGPTLTAYPKLRSRFWILIARSSTIGISKKISGLERTRLRVIAKTLQPSGFGLTVRTVAAGHSLEELQKDLQGLLSTWKSIMEHARSAALASDEGVDGAIPVMLHRAMGKTLSVVQDYFTEKVKSMVVDSPRTYHEVTNYLQEIAPNLCDRVELYSKRTPLFDEYKIEEEIDNILSKRVPLDNGGYLVIEQTEALVSIDVNGGQCMLGQGTSQEKAILDVNLAAAKQIARELRLRDIGGIIVVDFIDMMDDSNKRLVYEEVKKAVERDRSTVKVSELSRHGLMEITRKRVRPSVTFMISEPCTCCHGTGRVEALETSFSKIEHEICRMLSMMDKKADPENPKSWPRFILRVDRHMCNYLTSGKRTRLAVLSSSLKVWILLKVARGLTRGAFELKPLTDDKEHKNQNQLAIPLLRPTDIGTYTPSKKISLIPIKKWKTGGK